MAVLKFNPTGSYLFNSFFGMMDIKLGVLIISLFAMLNKVAGVYGIMAIITGGTFSQVSMYLYSIATILGILWGMKAISDESGGKTLVYAHMFALDHLLSTSWTIFFAVLWWFYNPHDGSRVANSDAQKELVGGGDGGPKFDNPEERARAAQRVWKEERTFAALVLILSWLIKVYFILCLYSFAIHLRRGTYHNLRLSNSIRPSSNSGYSLAPNNEDEGESQLRQREREDR